MRKELEEKLYYLRLDMDCIDGGQELRHEINGLTDDELAELIEEYEEA